MPRSRRQDRRPAEKRSRRSCSRRARRGARKRTAAMCSRSRTCPPSALQKRQPADQEAHRCNEPLPRRRLDRPSRPAYSISAPTTPTRSSTTPTHPVREFSAERNAPAIGSPKTSPFSRRSPRRSPTPRRFWSSARPARSTNSSSTSQRVHPSMMVKVEGVESADHPSDGELVAHARRFLKAADRMRPPS